MSIEELPSKVSNMTLNHVHLQVRDLRSTIAWIETILQARPEFANERMAAFAFGSFTLIFDQADRDVSATIGFASDNCDRDLRQLADRGATILEPPANKPWGVRAAYVKGPAALTVEIEGPATAS